MEISTLLDLYTEAALDSWGKILQEVIPQHQQDLREKVSRTNHQQKESASGEKFEKKACEMDNNSILKASKCCFKRARENWRTGSYELRQENKGTGELKRKEEQQRSKCSILNTMHWLQKNIRGGDR